MAIMISALQKVKQPDGSFQIVLPINTIEDVFVDMDKGINLKTRLSEIQADVYDFRDTVTEDFITVVANLSAFLPKPVQLNHIYSDDFSSPTRFAISSGVVKPGRILI